MLVSDIEEAWRRWNRRKGGWFSPWTSLIHARPRRSNAGSQHVKTTHLWDDQWPKPKPSYIILKKTHTSHQHPRVWNCHYKAMGNETPGRFEEISKSWEVSVSSEVRTKDTGLDRHQNGLFDYPKNQQEYLAMSCPEFFSKKSHGF